MRKHATPPRCWRESFDEALFEDTSSRLLSKALYGGLGEDFKNDRLLTFSCGPSGYVSL